MQTEPKTANPHPKRRFVAACLVAAYLVLIFSVAIPARPIESPWLIGIAMFPAAVCFWFDIPRAVKPRGTMALIHLLLFPLIAAIVLALPAALVTWQLGNLFSK